MRLIFLWALILICGLQMRSAQATDWSIDVVPELSKSSGQSIQLGRPFYVILTNVTNQDQTLWREWCSCGYRNLRFDFTGNNDKTYEVVKKSHPFLQNFPDPFVVHPGKHFVLAVSLSDKEWTGLENLNGPMRIQAIYQCEQPCKSLDQRIPPGWIGEVDSEPMEVTVER